LMMMVAVVPEAVGSPFGSESKTTSFFLG
jgi:hypothetical protein